MKKELGNYDIYNRFQVMKNNLTASLRAGRIFLNKQASFLQVIDCNRNWQKDSSILVVLMVSSVLALTKPFKRREYILLQGNCQRISFYYSILSCHTFIFTSLEHFETFPFAVQAFCD